MVDYKDMNRDPLYKRIWQLITEAVKCWCATLWVLICDNEIEIMASIIFIVMSVVCVLLAIEGLPDPSWILK